MSDYPERLRPAALAFAQRNLFLTMTFTSLGLSSELLRAVADKGYDAPTPIQSQAIPTILEGRDLMATAQTGTGKTAAFTLPLLQCLTQSDRRHSVRALVLVPTRELAAQVADSVRTYGRHSRLRCAEVYGGVNINPQMKQLRQGVDILVATPGRLIDHLQRRTVDLSTVEVLVLDEADRMLDMGFLPAIERIVRLLPRERQTLLFSATFSDPIRKLANRFLNNPQTIEVARRNTAAETVNQSAYLVDTARKRELLEHLFASKSWQQVLVFTRTKHGADRLAKQLGKGGIEAAAIHGNKSQSQRNRALADLKHMRVRALVATDVAARGIDINALPHVVNFDLPNNPEDYVHRIGRTGRGGKAGEAISLVSGEERSQFSAIKRLVKIDIPTGIVDGFEPSTRARTDANERSAPRSSQRRGRPDQDRHRRHAPRGQGADERKATPRGGDHPHAARSPHTRTEQGHREVQRAGQRNKGARDRGAKRRHGREFAALG